MASYRNRRLRNNPLAPINRLTPSFTATLFLTPTLIEVGQASIAEAWFNFQPASTPTFRRTNSSTGEQGVFIGKDTTNKFWKYQYTYTPTAAGDVGFLVTTTTSGGVTVTSTTETLKVTPAGGKLRAGGYRQGIYYYPPDEYTLPWQEVTQQILVDNSSTADVYVEDQCLDYLFEQAETAPGLGSLIRYTATNGRRVYIRFNNLRVPDHVLWSSSGNNQYIVIENNNIFGRKPTLNGKYAGRVFDRNGGGTFVFQHNYVTRMGGFKVGVNQTAALNVTHNYNDYYNIDGRRTGSYVGKKAGQLQAFQVASAESVTMRSLGNRIRNTPEGSRMEDGQNFFRSTFLDGLCAENLVIGAYQNLPRGQVWDNPPPASPANTEGYAGGGLINEQSGGKPGIPGALLRIEDNTVVQAANYGVAIASGYNSTLKRNTVVNGGILREGLYAGRQQIWASKGIYCLGAEGQVAGNNDIDANRSTGVYWPQNLNNPDEATWGMQGNPYDVKAPHVLKDSNLSLNKDGQWVPHNTNTTWGRGIASHALELAVIKEQEDRWVLLGIRPGPIA